VRGGGGPGRGGAGGGRVLAAGVLGGGGPGAAAGGPRPPGREFVVAWVQPTRSPDVLGWYGSRFIIEFRRGVQPSAGVLGPGFRFCQLLDDEGRERVRAVQNAVIRRLPPPPARVLRMLDDRARDQYLAQGRQVTAAYGPDHDVWFRYRDERDLDAWFRLLPVLLPGVLDSVRLRLG
jgi:hypothetical protein